ncbi:1-pyrroline-5-carboxylate dehydrogenase [Vibrio sp. SA48]|uniref:1-pyrroline-5-carboxylate dehydrogenase n=1 Tax=Vibrio aestuarianus TaxID=28171 RepID=A0AAX3U8H9_9VIBR|nr:MULTISPECIES: 1-pyrroline-5-carboxylate dehydrogenase [Vibrio]MBD1565888.1 1-pyrroline-5-carboxylate dehydrogenase [Vibrio sp. S12_S33]MDE1210854.1 1-pyrroline-5-carboxylate dehydrogenase [Vibrio aestuarianus]MDE1222057.1 1-pyrroline-5-carboxylate dehydrogenase [Vibrio aestuarianus]MDE1224104.1 1-pyrroline-5-carboxylate dehydrogenase [Vibrio aestuarianus]MDE1239899.1 1-pyrroline-5-carboxylate dehydrogenase [Vibrio aestuarianus]
MVHQVTRFSDAFSAWENWNITDFDSKCECLLSFKGLLQSSIPQLAKVMSYHLHQASALLAQPHQLIGPTGETNELYTAGRGVALIIQGENSDKAKQASVAQLCAALVAGNSVVFCSDDIELTQALQAAFEQSSLPANVIQFSSFDAYHQLMESDVRCLGYVGHTSVERTLNRQLASRTGAIVSLVSETDLNAIPVAHDPHLSLRFITERTRTINITAVGGNATLLELGSETH